MSLRLPALLACLALSACALGPRVDLADAQVFPTPPKLVRRGDDLYLRCERPEGDAARPDSVRCEVEGENLIVYVPLLVSAERERRVYPERLSRPYHEYRLSVPGSLRKLDDLTGRVFWLDPDGTQHELEVTSAAESGVIPAGTRRGDRR